jgi:hypothetical protein
MRARGPSFYWLKRQQKRLKRPVKTRMKTQTIKTQTIKTTTH